VNDTATTTPADEAEPPRCVACRRPISAWDLPRYACEGCQQRTAQQLRDLPDLYAALSVTPARTSSVMVGTRHVAGGSSAPINLAVVDLTSTASSDSVLMKLFTWADDWVKVRLRDDPQRPDDRPTRWDRDDNDAPCDPVEALCEWLRFRLDWACRHHLAVDDFVQEIGEMYGHLHGLATGDHGERPVMLACPCGGKVPFRLSGHRFNCGSCGARYGRAEVHDLQLAQRAAA
jgi:hypothetical protein